MTDELRRLSDRACQEHDEVKADYEKAVAAVTPEFIRIAREVAERHREVLERLAHLCDCCGRPTPDGYPEYEWCLTCLNQLQRYEEDDR